MASLIEKTVSVCDENHELRCYIYERSNGVRFFVMEIINMTSGQLLQFTSTESADVAAIGLVVDAFVKAEREDAAEDEADLKPPRGR